MEPGDDTGHSPAPAKFDQYADDYSTLHQQSIGASGESPEYFSAYKLHCLVRLLGPRFEDPILDYGCGIGTLTEHLAKRFRFVAGYDPSASSLSRATTRCPGASFHSDPSTLPDGHFGAAVLSGVLHHVPPRERIDVLRSVIEKLRPRTGRLVVFEHNPLNPLTRRAVDQCAFDDDAILLGPWEAVRLLRGAGLDDIERNFIVFFPKALAPLRPLEPFLRFLPIGAQMMLIGTRR